MGLVIGDLDLFLLSNDVIVNFFISIDNLFTIQGLDIEHVSVPT